MLTLSRLKKIDWSYLASRRESLLWSAPSTMALLLFRQRTGLAWQSRFRLSSVGGDILVGAAERARLSRVFRDGGVRVLRRFARDLMRDVAALDRESVQWEKTDYRVHTAGELRAAVRKAFRTLMVAQVYLVPMPVADPVLSDLIREALPTTDEQEREQWVYTLAFPRKENSHLEEERAFCKLVSALRENSHSQVKLLSRHVRDFGWIGTRGGWWSNAWTAEDILQRVEDFRVERKNPKKVMAGIERLRHERQRESDRLLNHFSRQVPALQPLVALAREYAYLRTWRTDVIYRAANRIQPMLREVAARTGFSADDVVYLSHDEVMHMAHTLRPPISTAELRRRKEYFACLQIGRKLHVLSGKTWQKQIDNFCAPYRPQSKEVRGTVAYPGKAIGRVRILRFAPDVKKVQRGDILVATMTFPHYIAAMERAAAFVTDEGGILCHAAIVAREMKKPCIIGTKSATRLFGMGRWWRWMGGGGGWMSSVAVCHPERAL